MIVGYVSGEALAMLFLFFGLTIAVIIKQLKKNFSFIPYAPSLFLVSVGLGYFADDLGIIGESINQIAEIDPRGILIIFLPPLVFESSFNADWYIFRKQSTQIFILAFPSVLVSSLILMACLKLVLGYSDDYYTWPQAFMFGSILSCTDTVAVLALLKEAGAPKKFSSLIEGESLFNDGSCMVLLTISLQLAKGQAPGLLGIGQLFLQLTIGAIALGVLFGIVSTWLLEFVKDNPLISLNITVVSCYLLYFTAEYVDMGIRISGIMALVSMGLYMAAFSRTRFSSEAREKIGLFWSVFTFIAETIIFILGGVLVGTKAMRNDSVVKIVDQRVAYSVILLYFCMMAARFISITVFMPKLQNSGYGLKWRQVAALTYGGLRGAVGIAFTLILAADETLPAQFRFVSLFNMAGCSLLTLMINAPTTKLFLETIGLCTKSPIKQKLYVRFLKECQKDLEDRLTILQDDDHLQNSDWQKVREQGGMKELTKIIATHKPPKDPEYESAVITSLNRNLLSDNQLEIEPSLMKEIRNRYCVSLKGVFWQKFETNQCSRISIKNLTQCVDLDLDTLSDPLNSWEYLINHLHNPLFFPVCFWLKRFPLVGGYAFSLIYDRVCQVYEVVSTYLEGLQECEEECRMLPFENDVLAAIIQESRKNRVYAEKYLELEIKIAFPEIMKRVQTSKAANSILNYQKEVLKDSHRHGQIDSHFRNVIFNLIDRLTLQLQKDSGAKDTLSDKDILMQNPIISQLPAEDLKILMTEKLEMIVQKDEPVIKSYEKQKYVFIVARGEIIEHWKKNETMIYKRSIKLFSLVGMSQLGFSKKDSSVQVSAVAKSVACLYCFPINIFTEILKKHSAIDAMISSELLPIQIEFSPVASIPKLKLEVWNCIKIYVSFKRLGKKQQMNSNDPYILVTEGTVVIEQQILGVGYYRVKGNSNEISSTLVGPGTFYLSAVNFLSEQANIRNQKVVPDARNSKVRRVSNMTDNNSAIKRTLYGRD